MKINYKNNKLSKAKLGDLFVVEDNKDLLMITQDHNQKYYLTSLKAGNMYGWGNGDPADSPDCLLQQVASRLTPVRAVVNVFSEKKK
mgnify:CR=1 FL=1